MNTCKRKKTLKIVIIIRAVCVYKENNRTIIAKEALRFLHVQGDESANKVVENGSDQDDQQEDLSLQAKWHNHKGPLCCFCVIREAKIQIMTTHLGLPLHACHRDPQEDNDSEDSYYSDII